MENFLKINITPEDIKNAYTFNDCKKVTMIPGKAYDYAILKTPTNWYFIKVMFKKTGTQKVILNPKIDSLSDAIKWAKSFDDRNYIPDSDPFVGVVY